MRKPIEKESFELKDEKEFDLWIYGGREESNVILNQKRSLRNHNRDDLLQLSSTLKI